MAVPHVLKDGADSVGLIGALSRVYVSIGEYSQEWLRDHNVMIGGTRQRPFPVARAQKDSVYFQATAERMPNLAKFLLKMQGPKLADAPGGKAFLTQDETVLQRGKIVFADNCAKCHSSKQPPAGFCRPPSSNIRTGCAARCRSPTSSTTTFSRLTSAFRSTWCRPTPRARWRPTR